MGKGIIKEIFILILLIAVIFVTLSILFYDFFHNTQELPEIREYVADSNTKSTIQEIKENSEDTNDGESLLKSYEIVSADLKNYASKKSYEKGKVNPFSEYPKDYENIEVKNEVSNTTSDSTTGTNTSGGNNSTNSSNQGSFFEKPNSK